MILVRKGLRVNKEFSIEGCEENVWVVCSGKKGSCTTIGCVYVRPGRSKREYEGVFDYLSEQVNNNAGEYMICGDFNVACEFNTEKEQEVKKVGREAIESFLEATDGKQCSRVVNHMGRALDLVFYIGEGSCEVLKSVWAAVNVENYHPVLEIVLRGKGREEGRVFSNVQKGERREDGGKRSEDGGRLLWREADFEAIYRGISEVKWDEELRGKGCNESVESFYRVLNAVIRKNVRREESKTVRSGRIGPKWLSMEGLKAIRNKNKCLREYRRKRGEEEEERYRNSRRAVKKLLEGEKREWEWKMECELMSDPRSFYKKLNMSEGDGVGGFRIRGREGVKGVEAANAFADKFRDCGEYDIREEMVGVSETGEHAERVGSIGRRQRNRRGSEKEKFNEEQVLKAIKGVSNTKAKGTDGIPMFVIKGCRDVIAKPLLIIFNRAYEEGNYPERWKQTVVVPIYKGKGDKEDLRNYRPVAIANTCSKVFERILREQLVEETMGKMCTRQHGYLAGRSTTSNLLELGRSVYAAIEGERQVDVVFTDLTSAFDMVQHDKLRGKMEKVGVSEGLICIIGSFVEGRECYVQVGDQVSYTYVRKRGVPQGSPLGGQLFIVFVNDVEEVCVGAEVDVFADDVRIYKEIRSAEDQEVLQGVIDRFGSWVRKNGLLINKEKCKVMTIARKRGVRDFRYGIGGVELERKTEFKDLGVVLDERFEFSSQRKGVVAKARRLSGFILRRTRSFREWGNIIKLFSALVRPVLEYAAVVWYPGNKYENKEIERVQSSFLRGVYKRFFYNSVRRYGYGSIYYSSEDVRKFFGVESLEARRKKGVIKYFRKVLVGGEGGEKARGEMVWRNGVYSLRRGRVLESVRGCKRGYLQKDPIIVFQKLCEEYGISREILEMRMGSFRKWVEARVV